MTTVATITVTPAGGLTDDSTLTIDGATTPIPVRAAIGGRLAPRRIVEALEARGYRPATNYYDDLGDSADGLLSMNVEPID